MSTTGQTTKIILRKRKPKRKPKVVFLKSHTDDVGESKKPGLGHVPAPAGAPAGAGAGAGAGHTPSANVEATKLTVVRPKPRDTKQAVTITFGDVAENHVGMQKIGSINDCGFTVDELYRAQIAFDESGAVTSLIDLVEESDLHEELDNLEEAYVLVVKNGVRALGMDPDKMLREQLRLDVDKKAKMMGRVVNKRARWNLCFSDEAQNPDYEAGKGRIVAFEDVPLLEELREALPFLVGDKAEGLHAEGNYYYDTNTCGIGYHGDAERRIVIAVRLGRSIPLCYQWYHRHKPYGEKIELELNHGDIYIMSDKATGHDWKKSSKWTLRHAAGCSKYTDVKLK